MARPTALPHPFRAGLIHGLGWGLLLIAILAELI